MHSHLSTLPYAAQASGPFAYSINISVRAVFQASKASQQRNKYPLSWPETNEGSIVEQFADVVLFLQAHDLFIFADVHDLI